MKNNFCSALTRQPLRPPPGRRCRAAPAAVLAARLAAHATAKRPASSSNSLTVRLVVARISRSEHLACSSEIMCAYLAKNSHYYQSPLMHEESSHYIIRDYCRRALLRGAASARSRWLLCLAVTSVGADRVPLCIR